MSNPDDTTALRGQEPRKPNGPCSQGGMDDGLPLKMSTSCALKDARGCPTLSGW